MEKTLMFSQLRQLTASAWQALEPVFHGHDFDSEIKKGHCQLWQVEPVGLYLITRIEKEELVICCAAGQALAKAGVYVLAGAINQGVKSVRFHTKRPALARLLNKAGFRFRLVGRKGTESIYRMGVQNGRA